MHDIPFVQGILPLAKWSLELILKNSMHFVHSVHINNSQMCYYIFKEA